MKKWIKSKTLWVNFGIGFLGLLTATMDSAPLDPQTAGFVAAGIAAANMALRAVTTKPLGKADA